MCKCMYFGCENGRGEGCWLVVLKLIVNYKGRADFFFFIVFFHDDDNDEADSEVILNKHHF